MEFERQTSRAGEVIEILTHVKVMENGSGQT